MDYLAISENEVKVSRKANIIDKASVIKELIDLRKSSQYLFQGISDLTTDLVNEYLQYNTTENSTNINYMFFQASNNKTTVEIPLFNTEKVTNARGCFDYCSGIQIIPALDFRNCTDLSMFCRYSQLIEEIWIKNIKADLQVGSGASYGHLIKQECLIHLIKELRNTGSAKTLIVGTANLTKLANIYVKLLTTITDEMRAEDDLIDEKLPFEVCESTDEGAMPITEYVLQKNWQIAG